MLFKKNGITVVEMLISITIAAVIIFIITGVFSQNIKNINIGTRRTDIEYGKHLIIKEIYINLINMNSKIDFDEENVQLSSKKSNFINLKDKTDNGDYRKINFNTYNIENFGEKDEISYYREGDNFVKEVNGRARNIVDNLEKIKFSYFNNMIYCSGSFYSEADAQKKELRVPFEFGIHLSGEKAGVIHE
ncbi:MAG: PulJ/GspJ family protein [Candidatus Muiribacteriota bacterium]